MTERCHLLDLFLSRRIGLRVRLQALKLRAASDLDWSLDRARRVVADEIAVLEIILAGREPSPTVGGDA